MNDEPAIAILFDGQIIAIAFGRERAADICAALEDYDEKFSRLYRPWRYGWATFAELRITPAPVGTVGNP